MRRTWNIDNTMFKLPNMSRIKIPNIPFIDSIVFRIYFLRGNIKLLECYLLDDKTKGLANIHVFDVALEKYDLI
ncbi:hypothetical protein RCL_jg5459.t1 [Rhizophagus clarus]|uniref:Uncharacterized protein n=1 Tax=Rhizophagus clarus TaxID=94130 RepID=A0A8H3R092_9GLOM|nr:hypothetical protein RCL_jg5459.t1 [Rhizophagus clarus]